jgi:uncharacterized membrane protein YkvA (DUF1232 family)
MPAKARRKIRMCEMQNRTKLAASHTREAGSVTTMAWLKITRLWTLRTRRDVVALWYALRHPDTPWYAKAMALLLVVYVISPIDLIPDFIPVLGYLDDIILVPMLIWAILRALPDAVRADSHQRALEWSMRRNTAPRGKAGTVLAILIWVAIVAAVALWVRAVWFNPAASAGAA